MSEFMQFYKNGRKIIGAAANYSELLKQLNLPKPAKPGLFLKATTSYLTEGCPIVIPQGFKVIEEAELGVIIGKRGKNIKECEAHNYIAGYCLGLDMTATCQLAEARKNGMSWTASKAFDTACPVSKFIPASEIPDPSKVDVWCKINGAYCQQGNTSDLAFNISSLISYISTFMTLEPNDLILTGSPPGMKEVNHGDIIEAGIGNIVTVKFDVIEEDIGVRAVLWILYLWLDKLEPFIKYIDEEEVWMYHYPVVPQIIPRIYLWALVVSVPVFVLLVEFLFSSDREKDMQEIGRDLSGLTLLYPMCCVVASGLKLLLGVPRPNFFHKCFPDGYGTNLLNCTGKYEDYMDGRKSFPSGHATISCATMIFLTKNLFRVFRLEEPQLGRGWKLTLSLLPIGLAVMISISSVCDYSHHFSDALGGMFIGITIGYLIYHYGR